MTPNVDQAGRSPLHYAAVEGRAADVAAYLQEHGDDVNLADKAGFTPLHFAAQGQHADVAMLLIEAGADLDARNRFGNTALLVALVNVRDKDVQVVRVLLDAGADPDSENNYGTSARGLAAKVAEVPRTFRTVHPLGWIIWKGEDFAATEEELLAGIQGRSRENGDRDIAPDRQSSQGAWDKRRHPR